MINVLKIDNIYFNINNVAWIEESQESTLAIDGNDAMQRVVRVYFNSGGGWEINPNSVSFRGQAADLLIAYLDRIAVDVQFVAAKD